MAESSIEFFPVQNGDTSLIRISDGKVLTNVIVDCHICENATYDIQTHLLNILPYQNGIPHVDVFILTHPHEDHVLGFQSLFYRGDPADYSDKDKKAGKIIIDELWFAPKIFNVPANDLPDDAIIFRKEAQRRIELYEGKKQSRSNTGNRLRIIGASNCDELADLAEITTYPGHTLNLLNNKIFDNFRFFIYAPIKKDSDEEGINPNNTSIVFQARFDIDGVENAVKVFMGGDAECPIWERIVAINDNENLSWDLFLASHHCSWSVFNLRPSTDDSEPSEKVLHLLNLKRGNAYIVASSKPILDDDKNPPSYRAKQIYVKKVGNDRFLCTGEHPTEKDPQPIYFTMSSKGVVKTNLPSTGNKAIETVSYAATSKPSYYG